jgi:hypothetical protein
MAPMPRAQRRDYEATQHLSQTYHEPLQRKPIRAQLSLEALAGGPCTRPDGRGSARALGYRVRGHDGLLRLVVSGGGKRLLPGEYTVHRLDPVGTGRVAGEAGADRHRAPAAGVCSASPPGRGRSWVWRLDAVGAHRAPPAPDRGGGGQV